MDDDGDGADDDDDEMMILMMPGAMTVTVVTISPSGREFPWRNLPARKVFLCRFRREDAAEKFYEVAPR